MDNNNNDKNISDLVDFCDTSPTVELTTVGSEHTDTRFVEDAPPTSTHEHAGATDIHNQHIKRLQQREQTIAELRVELLQQRKINDRLQAPATTNNTLRERIQDLETYIDGRKARWEVLHEELDDTRKQLAGAATELERRDSRITGFARTTAQLERRIDDQHKEIDDLRAQLTGHDARNRQSQANSQPASRAEISAVLAAAHRKLATMRDKQRALKTEIDEKNAYIDRLCGRMSRLELERSETVDALEKQRRIVERIEREIRSRLKKVAMSGRKPKQQHAISASIHRLDEQRTLAKKKLATQTANEFGRLTHIAEDGNGIEHPLEKSPMTLGRGTQVDIRIRHQSISRRHARLSSDAHGILIEDLDSKNGLRVNEKNVEQHRLQHGDVIAIGQVRFRFTDRNHEGTGHNAS